MPVSLTAVVTGATGILGSAVCSRLLREGYAVAGQYHAREDIAAALRLRCGGDSDHFRLFRADLSVPGAEEARLYEAMRQHLGPPGVMISCAGLKLRQSLLLTRPREFSRLLAVNVLSQLELARLALRDMQRERWGRVVLVGSRAGRVGMPGQAAYAASKASLSAWAASAAGEVGSHNITVNVLAPGVINAPSESLYTQDEAKAVLDAIGAKRPATPEDVADVIVFLCSQGACYINGATIPVDGGARF
jgi:3-oxoacyl-[acyl-carrier protein] reductase